MLTALIVLVVVGIIGSSLMMVHAARTSPSAERSRLLERQRDAEEAGALRYGVVESAGELLEAPLSRRPCVFYEVEMECYRGAAWVTSGHVAEVDFALKIGREQLRVESSRARFEAPLDMVYPANEQDFAELVAELDWGEYTVDPSIHLVTYRERRVEPGDDVSVEGRVSLEATGYRELPSSGVISGPMIVRAERPRQRFDYDEAGTVEASLYE